MTNLVDTGATAWRASLKLFGRPVDYTAQLGGASGTPTAYVRGLRNDDLFGNAEQFDVVAIMDAVEFVALFPTPGHPVRFDRLRTFDKSYSVEEWRPAPAYDQPVIFKVLLRGGSQ
jgi:hypothetical protein